MLHTELDAHLIFCAFLDCKNVLDSERIPFGFSRVGVLEVDDNVLASWNFESQFLNDDLGE